MTRSRCPHTEDVLAAARSGAARTGAEQSGGRPGRVVSHAAARDLAAHAAACRECADALLVERFLAGEAAAAAADARPADPAVVLWRARLARRHDAARRALHPIAVWERIAAVTAVAAVLGATALGGLGRGLGALVAAAGSDLAAALPLAAAALLLAAAGGGAYWAWIEE